MLNPLRVLSLAAALCAAKADVNEHRFKPHQVIPLLVNKIGPFANPSETYEYYKLPFCQPAEPVRESHGLGEIMTGDRRSVGLISLNFKVDVPWRELCTVDLSSEDQEKFSEAVSEEWYSEMFVDELPMWHFIGEAEQRDMAAGIEASLQPRLYLYTHTRFTIGYSGDQIVEVTVSNDQRDSNEGYSTPRLELGTSSTVKAQFTYSIEWIESPVKFEDRMELYATNQFLPTSFEIHWLSIVNSFVLVLLLTIFLSIALMRVLNADLARYIESEVLDEEKDELAQQEDRGWKVISGDVFRFPPAVSLLSAIVGAGAQLFVLTFSLLGVALTGVFHPSNRGAVYTGLIVLYAVTSGISGYVSARFYKQLGGDNWVGNAVLVLFIFPAPAFVVFSVANTVAIAHDSTAALPFGTILVILALWLFVAAPLTVIGCVVGFRSAPDFDAPCRTSKVPRELPDVQLWRHPVVQSLIAGFLPFSAIYIELHYVFNAVWGHKVYTLFGILLLAVILLVIVTCFVTIALAYFSLAAEDPRWWWRSFLTGGSTGFFVMAYCLYYWSQSEMFGFLQTTFFFGYMAIVSYAFFLMLGFCGFVSSLRFVRYVYGQIKAD